MHTRKLSAAVLALSLGFLVASTPVIVAQNSAGQDMKQAGTETKDAAQDAGHGIAKGTKKAYHKTKHETKKVAHKTENGTKTAAHKTETGTKDALHKVEGK